MFSETLSGIIEYIKLSYATEGDNIAVLVLYSIDDGAESQIKYGFKCFNVLFEDCLEFSTKKNCSTKNLKKLILRVGDASWLVRIEHEFKMMLDHGDDEVILSKLEDHIPDGSYTSDSDSEDCGTERGGVESDCDSDIEAVSEHNLIAELPSGFYRLERDSGRYATGDAMMTEAQLDAFNRSMR